MTTKTLITGASTGIGAVYAEKLAQQGQDLILVARSEDKLQQLAQRLIQQYGRHVEVVAADLTLSDDLERISQRIHNDTQIETIINNAGIASTDSTASFDSHPDQISKMISLNVTALTQLALAASKAFVQRQRGTIVNIASIVALNPQLLNPVYSATKAYVLSFTESLQHELSDKGVRLQAVLPGAIATPFWDTLGMPVENLPAEWVMQPEELVDAALKGLELGELVTIPSLPDYNDWLAVETARANLYPNLSKQQAAARYQA